jgi:hypothetical protein
MGQAQPKGRSGHFTAVVRHQARVLGPKENLPKEEKINRPNQKRKIKMGFGLGFSRGRHIPF